jgi:hypothetical protein
VRTLDGAPWALLVAGRLQHVNCLSGNHVAFPFIAVTAALGGAAPAIDRAPPTIDRVRRNGDRAAPPIDHSTAPITRATRAITGATMTMTGATGAINNPTPHACFATRDGEKNLMRMHSSARSGTPDAMTPPVRRRSGGAWTFSSHCRIRCPTTVRRQEKG